MKWASLTVPAAVLSGAAVAQSNSFSHVYGRAVVEKPATNVVPAVHEDTAIGDLEQLIPKTNVTLFYGQEGASQATKGAFSVLEVMMKYPAVPLEHSAFIKDISCHVAGKDGKDEDGHTVVKGQEGVDVQFVSKEAYDEATKAWPQDSPFVLITHHSGCGKYEQGIRSYHFVEGYTTDESQLSITAHSAEKELQDCMEQAKLTWGQYHPGKSQTAVPAAGPGSGDLRRRQGGDAPPPEGGQSSQEIIESGFDFQKDSKNGFVDVKTQTELIAQLVPGLDVDNGKALNQDAEIMEHADSNVSPTNDETIEGVTVSILQLPTDAPAARKFRKSKRALHPRSRDMMSKHKRRAALQKRWSFIDRIGKAVSSFVDSVVQMPANIVTSVVDFVQNPSVGGLVDILAETPAAKVAKLAGGLLVGDVTIDGSRTYGIEVPGPNQLADKREDTPWGPGIQVFKKEGPTSDGKGAGSITLWCVGCGLKGELNVAGTVTFSTGGITAGNVNIKGNMQFQLVAGLKAEFLYHDKQKTSLMDVNVGPFQIRGIAEAGFFVGIALNTEFDVKAEGQLEAGFRVEWDGVNAVLDLADSSKSQLDTIKAPTFHPIFDAKGDIAIGAEIGPTLSLSFGIKLLSSETLSAKVALIDSPSMSGVAKFKGHADLNPETGKVVGEIETADCAGVAIGFAVHNNLYVSLSAAGKELKTIQMDRRGLYEKSWCLQLPGTSEAPGTTEVTGTTDAPVPAKIKVKRQEEPAATEPAATTAAAGLPVPTDDFDPVASEASFYATLSSEAPIETALASGSAPFTVKEDMAETDAEDLSEESANEVLDNVNNDHKDSVAPSEDNSTPITFASIIAGDESGAALFPGADGNILSMKLSETGRTAADAFFFQVFGSSVISDLGERIIHIYKDSQEKFGVSRLRLSSLSSVPAQAQMVVLKEYNGAVVAVSTDQRFFALTVCEVTVQDQKVNKMYAIDLSKFPSVADGEAVLTSQDTDGDVTGGKADKCAVVPFKMTLAAPPADVAPVSVAP